MGIIKKYLAFAMLVVVYIVAVSVLLRSFYVYQKAYHGLSRLIAHSSIEVSNELSDNEEN